MASSDDRVHERLLRKHPVRTTSGDFARQLSLSDICAQAFCGRSTLQWQFKYHLKSSPIRYLTEIRMKYAAKLLENTLLPIKEIAQKSGCSDQLYFSNMFRKYHGRSPREYRKFLSL